MPVQPLSDQDKDRLKTAALEWVNEVRAKRGLEPRKELLPGIKVHQRVCCLARSLNDGLMVGGRVAMENTALVGPEYKVYAMPYEVQHFRMAFDLGQIPELTISELAI